MATETLVLNLLVLGVSGATSVIVGLVFRRIGDIAKDVKEIRADVGNHAAAIADSRARLEGLRKDVDGLLDRERDFGLRRMGT